MTLLAASVRDARAEPQEVRDYIRNVSQTAIVRRRCQLHYMLTIEGEQVVVDVTDDCDVYNYSTAIRPYQW